MVCIPVRRVRPAPDLPLPLYMTEGAAGADVYADIDVPVVLPPLGRYLVPTGLVLEIPPHFEVQVRPRSGLAHRWGITCLNTPGTIDSDYRGEVKVLLINLGAEAVTLTRGDRIAQLVVAPVVRALWQVSAEGTLPPTTRGEGGFGSTGSGVQAETSPPGWSTQSPEPPEK